MARGGSRPGAGRPRGSGTERELRVPTDIAAAASKSEMTPLEYMLKVMRNPDADQSRRDRMAQAAAPYCHGRVAEAKGKKESQAEEAKTAGSDWAGDLEFDARPN